MCRLGGRASGARASPGASAAASGRGPCCRGSCLGAGGFAGALRCSGRRPGPAAPWRLSGCRSPDRSELRSDSRFPGASVISISMISSHCSSVRSRSGMVSSSRSRRRGSWGGNRSCRHYDSHCSRRSTGINAHRRAAGRNGCRACRRGGGTAAATAPPVPQRGPAAASESPVPCPPAATARRTRPTACGTGHRHGQASGEGGCDESAAGKARTPRPGEKRRFRHRSDQPRRRRRLYRRPGLRRARQCRQFTSPTSSAWRHAHRFNARVLVALNTILKDEELEAARRLVWQVYEAGADALIVQDMGLLELDLPPIQLHASTQTDIRTSAESPLSRRRRLLADGAGARTDAGADPQDRRGRPTATLEFFVHGALCVSYSGQCNISHAQTGRSANRGDCSQACRLPYSLADQDGQVVAENKHLLSLKDNDQSANLRALIDAGISSFKIEGRLKDLAYVKNITAHYRQELDAIMADRPGTPRSSSGRSTFLFTPQPEKTFNRGSTDYFLNERHADVGAFDSPKFVGEMIGEVIKLGRTHFDVHQRPSAAQRRRNHLLQRKQELVGTAHQPRRERSATRIASARTDRRPAAGRSEGWHAASSATATRSSSAARKEVGRAAHPVCMRFEETATASRCNSPTIDRHMRHRRRWSTQRKPPRTPNAPNARCATTSASSATRSTSPATIDLALSTPWFIPASALNALRRDAVDALDRARQTRLSAPCAPRAT
jgi:collagenase-like PrtC family protease